MQVNCVVSLYILLLSLDYVPGELFLYQDYIVVFFLMRAILYFTGNKTVSSLALDVDGCSLCYLLRVRGVRDSCATVFTFEAYVEPEKHFFCSFIQG